MSDNTYCKKNNNWEGSSVNTIKELIDQATILCGETTTEGIARYLAEHNVITLPCKIDDVLRLETGEEARVIAFYIDKTGGMLDLFVTEREETVGGYKSFICKDFTFEDVEKSLHFVESR